MSLIRLSGNASGTGTVTLASPNTNSDFTLNLPAANGTVNTSGATNEVPAGTASAPAIYPTGDTNTGIFFPAADTIAFTEGGTESARFDSSGRFGIGTTSPAAVLDVRGSIGSADAVAYVTDTSGTGASSFPCISFRDTGGQRGLAGMLGDNFHINAAPASGAILFRINNTERARINANGNLALQGATASANGVGITFPASQSASSDANCLDDYEEGTWTPAWGGTNSEPTATYTDRAGNYVKIGRMVHCRLRINTASFSGGSGLLQISGLPFTVDSSGIGWSGVVGWNSTGSFSNNQNMVNIQTQPSSTRMYTHYINSTGATFDVVIGTGTNNSMIIEASITYQASA